MFFLYFVLHQTVYSAHDDVELVLLNFLLPLTSLKVPPSARLRQHPHLTQQCQGLSMQNILADFVSCKNISLSPSSQFHQILGAEVNSASLGMCISSS